MILRVPAEGDQFSSYKPLVSRDFVSYVCFFHHSAQHIIDAQLMLNE